MKQFFFLCGLPRSGSTTLTSILSQHPSLYASPNSALVELLVNVRHHLQITEQARAFMQPTQEQDVLQAIMEGMYAFTDKPFILDKSRAWPHPDNIKLLIDLLPYQPKFIAVVRDLPAIFASFISLIEKNPDSVSFIDRALRQQGRECTNENRCAWLFSPGGTVHESWFSLKAAFDAGYRELFHVIEYDDLVAQPDETLRGIYDFLGLPDFEHNLTDIVNKTPEDDSVYNLPGMHEVRPQLQKTSPNPLQLLGSALLAKYENVPHFWRAGEERAAVLRAAANPFNLRKP